MPEKSFRVGGDRILFSTEATMNGPGSIHESPHAVGLEQFLINHTGTLQGLRCEVGHSPQWHWLKVDWFESINRSGNHTAFIDVGLSARQGEDMKPVDRGGLTQEWEGVKPRSYHRQRRDWLGEDKSPAPAISGEYDQACSGVFPECSVGAELMVRPQEPLNFGPGVGERQGHVE
jgi:hypothetical protein